ncbi:MAG: DUF2249 domain-containing protein [Opitutaceae bacterium]|nr:DUF2249 domain-containing protein [Opitutaceae bacterium]
MSRPRFRQLDIRPALARGEEPFALIRSAVDRLAPGDGLTVVAPFLPAPLIELLRGEGFRAEPTHRPDGAWSVNFWRD